MSKDTSAPSMQHLDPWFIELLCCAVCDQRLPVHLSEAGDRLLCACGRYAFPIRDGIPSLLEDQAILLDEHAHPEDVTGAV